MRGGFSGTVDSMSEENATINEGDLIVPAPADFDMFAALEGIEYPEDEVTVALNEKAAHRLASLMREIAQYQVDHPSPEDRDEKEVAEFARRVDELKEAIKRSRVTFYLRGIPDDLLTTAGSVAEEKFESVKKDIIDAQGNSIKILPQSEKIRFMRYMNAVTYSLFIQKVHYHSNGVVRAAPSADEIAAFMDKAPDVAKGKLVTKIQELRVKSEAYEAQLDEGFFPKS